MGRDDAFYRAMLARDYRFDGKFFVGVRTTGIYCRPICPAKPRRENVEFFASAHLAERAGYRPCLRCRPEAAPRSPAWVGRSALVQRALRALGEPDHGDMGEEEFAGRFGVSARHLRRLFEEEIGKSPTRILHEGRLDFARKLIVETSLPMADIAFTSGFASIRRFNHAVRERFQRTPTQLRKPSGPSRRPGLGKRNGGKSGSSEPGQSGSESGTGLLLDLSYRPPLDWDASLAYYRSHGLEGLETFREGTYERLFRFGGGNGSPGKPGLLRVSKGTGPANLVLQVLGGEIASLGKVVRAVRRMFDLDSDPLLIANAFAADPRLHRLRKRHPGLRSPRGWDSYEVAISAILGQLVSIAQANRMIAQLIKSHGPAVRHPLTGAEARLFPSAETVADASLEQVGTTRARKEVLREFSRRLLDGRLSLDSTQDPEAFRAALLDIKGIGPWTAEYISLRAIADTDAFPATDLVLKRALQTHPGLDPEAVKPWRGYAAAHLWHAYGKSLSKKETPRTARKGNPK